MLEGLETICGESHSLVMLVLEAVSQVLCLVFLL